MSDETRIRMADLGARLPVFAGRGKEMAALNQRLEALCETGDPTGGVALVVGVPGAGKTQLALNFAANAMARPAARAVGSLATGSGMLACDGHLFMAMARALGMEQAGRRILCGHARGTGRTVVPPQKGVAEKHPRRSLSALLEASRSAAMWEGRALVLIVDELQTIKPSRMGALRVLHRGAHGCPILLLGVGLPDTEQVLANPADGSDGVSPAAAPLRLASLSKDEAADAIRRSLAALGEEPAEASVVALATASRGVPRHIHGYLSGALEAIAKHGSLEVDGALDCALTLGRQRNRAFLRHVAGEIRLRAASTAATRDRTGLPIRTPRFRSAPC